MKKAKMYFFLGVLVLMLVPAMVANAEVMTITGKMTGLACVTQGYLCPVDKADPMINLEKDFVVVTATGDYYFLNNIGLGLKARHALEVVEVSGDVNAKYKSMTVKTMKKDGKEIWSPTREEEIRKLLYPSIVGG
jgi:hypothetical protein